MGHLETSGLIWSSQSQRRRHFRRRPKAQSLSPRQKYDKYPETRMGLVFQNNNE